MASASRLRKSPEGIWHYYRRVPAVYRDVDPRLFVKESLKTRDLAVANRRKARVEQIVEARWTALKKGQSDGVDDRYEAALELAKIEGFDYRPVEALAEGNLDELMARVRRVEEAGVEDGQAAVALLGGADAPEYKLSWALKRYIELTRADRANYSDDQKRRWEAPRRKAVANFVALIADKPIAEITRADALKFRDWWVDQVMDGKTANSANKDIGHLSQIIRGVGEAMQLDVGNPFTGLRLKEHRQQRRPPFSSIWIRETLLKPGALDGLDRDEILIIHALIETGLRPVECVGLEEDDIILTANIPYVDVNEKLYRRLKTAHSARQVPLVGVSLEAFRAAPEGFPRYRDKSSQLSDRLNHYLRERGLLESDRHSIYSLRHSFDDRLTAAETPDRIHTDLMGHRLKRPKYGSGTSLELKHDILMRTGVTTRLL